MITETLVSAWEQAILSDGLIWIALAAFIAGVVRGFAGFGTAMIFLPVAGQYVSPFWAIGVLAVMDIFGPIPVIPRAWRDAHRPDLFRLIVGMAVTVPVALWLLSRLDPAIFRYVVSAIALGMLVILGLGLRYQGQVRPKFVYGIGAMAGITGGISGIPGPPVILFYMASAHKPSVIRANNLLFLMSFDFVALPLMAVSGVLSWVPIMIGAIMVFPMLVGNVIGARLFDPEKERLYRGVAYAIIAVSAIKGLPLFD